MSSYSQWLQRLSRSTPLLVAATATTLLIAIPTIRLTLLHRHLAKRINGHCTRVGQSARDHLKQLEADSVGAEHSRPPLSPAQIPDHLLAAPSDYNLFRDLSVLTIPTATLPRHLSTKDLLTAYLQRTMTLFSTTPQAYAMWALSPKEARRSFDREWIESLPFEEGGLVNGMYRVLGRSEDKEGSRGWVCFGMAMNGVEGRLVIGLCRETPASSKQDLATEDISVFSTETWMWVEKDKHIVMPMERRLPRLMHRIGSWWLLVEGTEWLQALAA
jgi:hypothetical protein